MRSGSNRHTKKNSIVAQRWQPCWDADRLVYTLLRESDTLVKARRRLIRHLDALDWEYRHDPDKSIESWKYFLLKEAVRCLKNIISERNERLAENSSLKYLWHGARGGEAEVRDGFILEFTNLFRAINGHAEVYPPRFMHGIRSPDFDKYRGRAAAIRRSDFLEKVGERMNEYLQRYPSGLEQEIIERRRRHKKRILKVLGATEKEWNDWAWHFKHVFINKKDVGRIKQTIRLTPQEEQGIVLAIENRVPFGITPHYLHLMDEEPSDLDFAIRRQVFPPVPYVKKMGVHKWERKAQFDFMRERDTSPLKLVTRRYPRVAILKPYDSCPQICVYCQRNWEITSPFMAEAEATKQDIDRALDWFREQKSMMDVLITGGDPLVMSDQKIEYILKKFADMTHIRNIRIASRIPISVPQRITPELCDVFSRYHNHRRQTLCLVTHFVHPYEVTPETARVIERIRMRGISVYNQQVFTFANSRRFESVALRIVLKQIGVDPYYNFNLKGKTEMESYAVPVARILQENKEEARLLPGVFRTDEPVFNVPFLGKNYLRAWQEHELISILPDGRRVYSFHPWEKNIAPVKPYIYTDVPILDY
ncbi:MAG: KamA family radical SAM protein, partial [candidate division WOR-3 bacterium]